MGGPLSATLTLEATMKIDVAGGEIPPLQLPPTIPAPFCPDEVELSVRFPRWGKPTPPKGTKR